MYQPITEILQPTLGKKIGITYITALATHVDIRVLGCLEHPMTKLKIEWKRWHKEIETNPLPMTKSWPK